MQPPAQELMARDLHDQTWTFRHIYRGTFQDLLLSYVGGLNLIILCGTTNGVTLRVAILVVDI